MKLEIPIQFNEEKLKELVIEAIEKLKAEGYIWREGEQDGKQLLGREISEGSGNSL